MSETIRIIPKNASKIQKEKHIDSNMNTLELPNQIIAPIIGKYDNSDCPEGHYLVRLPITDAVALGAVNWRFNRPPDLTRIPEIARYYYSTHSPMDTVFYMNFNQQTGKIEVIDGIHRYSAICYLIEQNKKPRDLLDSSGNYGYDSNAEWLYNGSRFVLISITIDAPDRYLIDLFQTLNKSVVVPDLYMGADNDRRGIIEDVANNWMVRFSSMFSTSSRYQRPNMNRDEFIGILDAVYDRIGLTGDNNPKNTLLSLLEDANENVKKYQFRHKQVMRDCSASMIMKCSKSGCYLFLYKRDELITLLTTYYEQPHQYR